MGPPPPLSCPVLSCPLGRGPLDRMEERRGLGEGWGILTVWGGKLCLSCVGRDCMPKGKLIPLLKSTKESSGGLMGRWESNEEVGNRGASTGQRRWNTGVNDALADTLPVLSAPSTAYPSFVLLSPWQLCCKCCVPPHSYLYIINRVCVCVSEELYPSNTRLFGVMYRNYYSENSFRCPYDLR